MQKRKTELPILFNTEMVKAIFARRKTRTSRVILPQPYFENSKLIAPKSRYGQPGDTLWVRETWAKIGCIGWEIDKFQYEYKADFNEGEWHGPADMVFDSWKPSIHMPRAAARLFLTNTGEKIERIQDITEADAIAEGIEKTGRLIADLPLYKEYYKMSDLGAFANPKNSFASLWNSININPKPAKRNPYTGAKEDCYISFPWHDIRATEQYRGKTHYIVGNPWVRAVSFSPNLPKP